MGNQTALNVGVSNGKHQEHKQRQESMHKIYDADLVLAGIYDMLEGVVVEDVETSEGGNTVVELAVAAGEAVGKGGEEAEDSTDDGDGESEELVGHVAGAIVGEGRD